MMQKFTFMLFYILLIFSLLVFFVNV